MTSADALTKLLPMYGEYYTVTRDAAAPFAAEAFSSVSDEQYAAFRTVKISEAVSAEQIFFSAVVTLDEPLARSLSDAAWEEGLSRVKPGPNHRNTDIILIILADRMTPEAAGYLKRIRRSRNYKCMLHGWSSFRVIAIETTSGNSASNRLGRSLKPLFGNINFSE